MAKLEDRSGAIVLCANKDTIYIPLVKYKRKDNKVIWDIPRGHVEPKESFKKTAIRELYEETGILVPTLQYRTGKLEYAAKTRNVLLHYDIVYYATVIPRCKTLSPKDKDEIAEARWFSLPEFVKILPVNQLTHVFKATVYFIKKGLLA